MWICQSFYFCYGATASSSEGIFLAKGSRSASSGVWALAALAFQGLLGAYTAAPLGLPGHSAPTISSVVVLANTPHYRLYLQCMLEITYTVEARVGSAEDQSHDLEFYETGSSSHWALKHGLVWFLESHLVMLEEQYEVPGIEPRLDSCQKSTFSAVLSLWTSNTILI